CASVGVGYDCSGMFCFTYHGFHSW
nr:immunoglobulin heavy chain junction region [Macaca mulatta]